MIFARPECGFQRTKEMIDSSEVRCDFPYAEVIDVVLCRKE